MALPIIPTDINGANRFNQFDPSIMGLILKTTNNDPLLHTDPRAQVATRCTRYVEYWGMYPGDIEGVPAYMCAPHSSNADKNMIIGKLTGFWRFNDLGKSYEVKLFNPSWGSKGQMIYYLDYIVPTGIDMHNNYNHMLLVDDGKVTGKVAADTHTRTGIYAVSTQYVAMDNNLFPHFDADYPVAEVEKWDKYFKFDRAAWAATIYPQVGNAGGYTDLWIWHGYDFKVPISENHFGLMAGKYASELYAGYEPYDGRQDDFGVTLNYSTTLNFFGRSKWLGGYCKTHGFVISSSNLNPTKGAAGCVHKEKGQALGLSDYYARDFHFSNLTPNTTYYYRQYYIIYDNNGDETIVYQAVKTLTTLNQTLETIVTCSTPRFLTSSSVSYNVMIRAIGTKSIKEIGVVVGKTANPVPNAPGTFKATSDIRIAFWDWANTAPVAYVDYSPIDILGLEPDTLYYNRQYVIYSDDSIFYPNCDTNAISLDRADYLENPENRKKWTEFRTSKAAQTVPKIVLNCTFGEVQFDTNAGRTYISAQITNTGGSKVTARGVCYNTTGNPMANGTNGSTVIIVDEEQERRDIDATFYPTVTGLKANTKYYFRAFATNATGTGYSDGSTELATTTAPVINDFIKTTKPSVIKATSAKAGGAILNNGGSTVTAKGIVWSLLPSPTVTLATKTTEAISENGLGLFESTMNNLLPSRKYYVRAYFTNATETKYGEEFSFYTADLITAPVVSAIDAKVTTSSVTLGMNTMDDGGAVVTNKLVWAEKTSGSFVLPNVLPTSGHINTLTPGEVMGNTTEIPIGSFVAGKTYVFRGYADNGQMAAVTAQKEFSIPAAQVAPVPGACTLSTKTNASLTIATAISALNNNTIISHDILFGTATIATPESFTKKESLGTSISGMATFTGLAASTTYYVRSLVTYQTPTGEAKVMGTQTTFTTDATATAPVIPPSAFLQQKSFTNNLGVFQIGTQGDISEKGIVYSTTIDPTISNARVKADSLQITDVSVMFPEAKEYYVRAYIIQSVTGNVFYSNQLSITVTNIITSEGIPLNPTVGQIYAKGARTWKYNGEGWQKNN